MIDILTSQTITASGASQSKAIAKNSFARLAMPIAAVSGSLSVYVETSNDDSNWRVVYSKVGITVAEELDIIAYDLGSYIRVRYVVSASGSATLSCSFDSLTSYASVKDFYRLVCPAERLTGYDESKVALALLQASTLANSYLSARYSMPLLSWGDDLTRNICLIAQYDAFTNIGIAQNDDYDILKELKDNAEKWLKQVSNGNLKPSIIDSSATTTAPSTSPVLYYTSDLRGW